MSDSTPQPITTPPAGYTLDDGYLWYASYHTADATGYEDGEFSHINRMKFSDIVGSASAMVVRDNDGNVVFDDDALATVFAQWNTTGRFIPDSEIPAGGMSRYHTIFNETTGKWEQPDATAEVARAIEEHHDSDVHAALQNHAQWGVLEDLMLARYGDRANADHRAKMAAFHALWDKTSGRDSLALIAEAWRRSLGKVEQPFRRWAMGRLALANAKLFYDALPTGSVKVKYIDKLVERFDADAAKSATSRTRNYPREVVFVEKLSVPANAKERTVASVVAGIKAAVFPSEGG